MLPATAATILNIHPVLRQPRAKLPPSSDTPGLAAPNSVIPSGSRLRIYDLSFLYSSRHSLVGPSTCGTNDPKTQPRLRPVFCPGLETQLRGAGQLRALSRLRWKENNLLTGCLLSQWHFRLYQLPGGEGPEVHCRHSRQRYVPSMFGMWPSTAPWRCRNTNSLPRRVHLCKTRTRRDSTRCSC